MALVLATLSGVPPNMTQIALKKHEQLLRRGMTNRSDWHAVAWLLSRSISRIGMSNFQQVMVADSGSRVVCELARDLLVERPVFDPTKRLLLRGVRENWGNTARVSVRFPRQTVG